MNPYSYAHLIFDKGAKNYDGQKIAFSTKVAGEKWLSTCKSLKVDPCLSPYIRINYKWIKDLNISPQTLKLVQEMEGNNLEAIGVSKDFLNRTPVAQQQREMMEKWDLIKLKSFHTTKEMISEQTTHRVGENICQLYIRQRTDNQNILGT
jgi:hypothetical protein